MSYGRARAPFPAGLPGARDYLSFDGFNQTSGALTGKADDLAKTWAGAGSATDIRVAASAADTDPLGLPVGRDHTAYRNAGLSGDGNVDTGGRFCSIGSTVSNVLAHVRLSKFATGAAADVNRMGVLLRYTDPNDWLMATLNKMNEGGVPKLVVRFLKRASGGAVTYMEPHYEFLLSMSATDTARLVASVSTNGIFRAWTTLDTSHTNADPPSDLGEPRIVGHDVALQTGGALATGKAGLYHANTTTTNVTNNHLDEFWATTFDSDVVVHPSRLVRFTHDAAQRQNAGGTAEGDVPMFQGEYPTVAPATRDARNSRLVVKARRLDVDSGLPDQGLADALTGACSVTPRVWFLDDYGGS